MNKASVLKDAVMQGIKVDVIDVPMPEWGDDVFVTLRPITAEDRDIYEATLMTSVDESKVTDAEWLDDNKERMRNMRARWLVMCICDPETLERVFSDEEALELGQCPADDIDKLYEISQKQNGVDNDITDDVKNSEAEAVG